MTHEELVKRDTSCAGTEEQDAATTGNCLGRDHSPLSSSVHVKKRGQKIAELRVAEL